MSRSSSGSQGFPFWDRILEELDKVTKKYDTPVKLAIVGFAKAGKSTLFNALYGRDVQEVGAQTDLTTKEQEARRFGIIFTDTRGFGTQLVPLQEIMEAIEREDPHLIIHCINGMASISGDDAELYAFCRKTGKRVIVVITKADAMKEREVGQFAQSIAEKIDPSIKPIFISAETGLNLLELTKVIIDLLPEAARDAFIAKQQVDRDAKRRKARAVIHTTSLAAAGVAISPIPVSDVIVLIPMQAVMVVTVGKIYGYDITPARAKEILAVAGGGVVLRYAFQVLVKFIPGVGSILGPAIAYGGTVAIGEAAILYFESGMEATPEEIADVYRQAKEQAEQEFKASDVLNAMKRHEDKLKELKRQLENGEISQSEYEKRVNDLIDE